MQNTLLKLLHLINHLGIRWVVFRLRHAFRLRTGYFIRRSPARPWADIPWQEWCAGKTLNQPESYLEWRRTQAPPFLFSANDFPQWAGTFGKWDSLDDGMVPSEAANKIHVGTFPHYTIHWLERGNSPDWFLNPFTGERAESNAHWSNIADSGLGDIKHIWELSRFAWVYPLVRAYARDGDPIHAETFWTLLDDWLDKNPPNTGVNWMCGQETSIRLMAWMFGLYAVIATPATTPERHQRLALAVAESARRVEANLGYALSQKNNHGITECVGLITVGVLFPEMRRAEQWKASGLNNLRRQVKELFYADGSFSQHSPNYERMALQALIWVHQLLEKNRFESDGWLQSAIGQGGRFLFEICQPETGEVPNSGGNDGTLLLPLSNCSYNDFRPVIQAAHVCGHGQGVFESGPWDEELLWLGMSDCPSTNSPPMPLDAFDAPNGGTHTLRSGDWAVIARAPEFKHRPAHADLLHVDLWWRGKAVAVDAGTYAYRAEPPFEESFRTTRFHNTVEVDGISQMEPAGRFMLLPWAKARLVERGETKSGNCRWMIMEQDAYQRLADPVRHRRAVIVEKDFVAIVDWMVAKAAHRYRLHWLLTGDEDNYESRESHGKSDSGENGLFEWKSGGGERLLFEIVASGDEGKVDCVTGDHGSARGWQSRHYMEKDAANSIVMECTGNDMVFVSVFSEDRLKVELNKRTGKVVIGEIEVELRDDGIHIGCIG